MADRLAGPVPADAARRTSAAGSRRGRDEEAVGRFVERFASVLTEAGIPRMPARVFAALLAADSSRLTAAELAGMLQCKPGRRVRRSPLPHPGRDGQPGGQKPGSRRHHYRVPDDVWDEVIRLRDRLMARWTGVMREGVELLGADTPAGARLADSVRYFEFVSAELPQVLARWREHKAALDSALIRVRRRQVSAGWIVQP